MKRLLLGLLFVLAPLTLHAQALVAQFSSCGFADASNNYTLTTNAIIPADSLIVANTAVDSQTTGNTFVDNQGGNNYGIGIIGGFNVASVIIQWTRFVSNALPSGTVFTWHADNQANHKACMYVLVFSGVAPTNQSTSSGVNTNTNTAPSASGGNAANGLVLMATSFLADPGTITGSGLTLPTKICQIGAQTFCLQPAFKVVSTTATQTITLGTTSSTTWSAAIATYAGTALFSNGFE
jgi:hypothetical protein